MSFKEKRISLLDNINLNPKGDWKTTKQIEDEQLRWYALSVVSGQENVVKVNLKEAIRKNKLENDIVEVFVPEIIEVYITKKKERKQKIKKMFPGYVFVKSRMNDKIWYILRNTPGVRLVIGSDIHPIPVSDSEIEAMKQTVADKEELASLKVPFKVGNIVRVKKDNMEWIEWKIIDINERTWELKIEIELMGRKVVMNVDVTDIEKAF